MKRRQIRELAFQLIYQIDVGKNQLNYTLQERLKEETNEGAKAFCEELVKGTFAKLEEIDEIIQKNAVDWKVERMSSVDRNLLRLAVFEMLYYDNTPPKVALNEAIELAKIFGSEESPKFINGILGKIIKYSGE